MSELLTYLCEYCGRLIPPTVDQADLPYPENVTCSDSCSIFLVCHNRVTS